jgi:ceramide glucosyltransferase
MFHPWMIGSGLALATGAAIYSVVALAAVFARSRPVDVASRTAPPSVTIFKPLCGAEPETYECLRSFCDQDYPEFQVVFGVADMNDPVVPLIKRLQAEFPVRDLQLVVDRRQHGTSRKVSNLVNMFPAARHDYFVIADSDVRVERGYLSRIMAPLEDEGVGIVTCAYRGVPRAGVWSLLGSQFINEWFIPSVRVAALGGSRAFAFGVTIAMSRRVLCRIGGFMAIVNQLADDYRLGELTRNLGLRTVLSDVVVETFVAESSLAELVRHEVRWLRTIRAVRPVGYLLAFITFGVPVAALGALLSRGAPITLALLALTAVARTALHFKMRSDQHPVRQLLVLPFRDLLSVALWNWGFVTRSVHWRDALYLVNRDGSVLPVMRV